MEAQPYPEQHLPGESGLRMTQAGSAHPGPDPVVLPTPSPLRAHELHPAAEANPSDSQPTTQSTGKGGRPKSSVWRYFETERKRDDKSKREDVRCKFCSIVMPGRAEGMERHVAVDCSAVDPQAKADMSQHLYNKKMQTLERKGVKRRAAAEGGPSAEPGAAPPMMEGQPMAAPPIHPHMPAYSVAVAAAVQGEEAQQNGQLLQIPPMGTFQAAAPAAAPPPPSTTDIVAMLQQVLRGQHELRAISENVPRRMRNSRVADGAAVLRPLCRERYGVNGALPGVMPPHGLFPGTWGEALRIDAYKIDQLAGFYGESFGITLSDSLEEKQTKFLEWAGAVRP
ncbi:g1391 [Coccomyxa elongata]